MYGTVKEISAELFREYGADEPLAVLIWDAAAVRFFAHADHPTDADVLAILESIGCTDIDTYQEQGVNRQCVEGAMQHIVNARAALRSVAVNAQALEAVLALAALAIDMDDPHSQNAEFIDDIAAIEAVRAALNY